MDNYLSDYLIKNTHTHTHMYICFFMIAHSTYSRLKPNQRLKLFNYLKEMSSNSFKNNVSNKLFTYNLSIYLSIRCPPGG